MSLPTPHIAHLTQEDYEHVYEPAEDSFILLDALEADAVELRTLAPTLCLEIGSGSGIVSTFLAQLLGPEHSLVICSDINPNANAATMRTALANNVDLEVVRCHLLDNLRPRIDGRVQVLVFNPPYVPTNTEELEQTQSTRGIGGAWAGGDDGMEVTNQILAQVQDLLAPGGRFYLVAVEQNRPQDIKHQFEERGFRCDLILRRRAGRELLSVVRVVR